MPYWSVIAQTRYVIGLIYEQYTLQILKKKGSKKFFLQIFKWVFMGGNQPTVTEPAGNELGSLLDGFQ